ncbi:MAG: signal peptidase II [Legionellales bacterium RIFCSPHIGHO2_12_FULL_42_9]|nr:MAG: signal peptidase II [Legionellales bacterium RIFCSPHIGHO2_12_FULL_42_9]
MSKASNWHWFLLSVFIVMADQLTKYMAEVQLTAYQPFPVLPMFNLTLAYNTGAAFSFLSHAGDWHRWFFAGFSFCMSVFFVVWMVRLPAKACLQLTAISLILGGTLGNFFDRLFSGHVIDFIQLYYHQYYWPVFNLADSAICVGAVLLLLDLSKNNPKRQSI